MQFKDINGRTEIKRKLIETVKKNRISHAQLFLGKEGVGKMALALAYAQYINCENPTETDSCGECKACKKIQKLAHPDLHFIYPVVRTKKISKPVSVDFINKWRDFLLNNKYISYNQWLAYLSTDNLQGNIYAQESKQIIKIINLKTFEAKYKILIIYMPERMNISASNKLLKAIEEPPPNTVFLLVSEDESQIITTIRSRTQLIKIPKLNTEEIQKTLSEKYNNIDKNTINDIAKISDGNIVYAEEIIKEELTAFEGTLTFNLNYFKKFMRLAYTKNFKEITDFVDELSKLGREKQKDFLNYSLRMIRENFILNQTKNKNLNKLTKKEYYFSEKFCNFINSKNTYKLFEEFNNAYDNIVRNASAKILFLNLILKSSQLIKTKT